MLATNPVRFLSSLIFLMALLSAAPLTSMAQATNGNGLFLVGSWKVDVDSDAFAPPFLVLQTYHIDGTMTETASSRLFSSTHGVWNRTGARSFNAARAEIGQQ